MEFCRYLLYACSSKGSQILLNHQYCSENIFRFHTISISLHCLNPNFLFIREENIDLAYKTTISVKENIWVNVLTPNAITNVKIQIYYVKCYTNEKGNAYSAEIRFCMHNLIFIKYLPKVKMTKHFASKQIN